MWMAWGPDAAPSSTTTPTCPTPRASSTTGRWARAPTAVWAEIWDAIGPRIEHVMATGDATWDEGLLLFLERSGYPGGDLLHLLLQPRATTTSARVGGMLCVVSRGHRAGHRRAPARPAARARGRLPTARQTRSTSAVAELRGAATRPERATCPSPLLYLLDADGAARGWPAPAGIAAGMQPAPAALAAGGADAWPRRLRPRAARRCSTSSAPRCGPTCRRPWPEPPRSRPCSCPLARPGRGARSACLVRRRQPLPRRSTTTTAASCRLVAGQIASPHRQRPRLRGGAAARRGAGRARPGQDHVLLQRQPRVPHAADPDARAARGRAGATPACRPRGRAKRWRRVHRNALRLLKLVNTLLDFSRIEAGRVQARYEPTDLAALTAELASVFRSAIERAGCACVSTARRCREPVYVDREMWEKIVLNLLSNAFKFTFEGEIAVGAARRPATRRARRCATPAPASPADELPRALRALPPRRGRARPHPRRHRHRPGAGAGAGAGCTAARSSVDSAPGRGTHLHRRAARSARRTCPPTRIGCAARPSRRTAAGATPSSRRRCAGCRRWRAPGPATRPRRGRRRRAGPAARVLVADDNADMRDYVAPAPGAALARSRPSPTAQQALGGHRAAPPDLVLTDVMMPGSTASALLRALRADRRTRALPVMLLSARAGEEARVEGLRPGPTTTWSSRSPPRELLARVESQLDARARVRRVRARRTDERLARRAPRTRRSASRLLAAPTTSLEFVNPQPTTRWPVGRDAARHADSRGRCPSSSGQGVFERLRPGPRHRRSPHRPRLSRCDLRRRRGRRTRGDRYFDFVYQPPAPHERRLSRPAIAVMCDGRDRRPRQRRATAAEAANRAKDEFLAMLGHELRNPLAPILTALQLMQLRGRRRRRASAT